MRRAALATMAVAKKSASYSVPQPYGARTTPLLV
eukprot:CAMPEP_0197689338 /NCGR_PEP_ID=MMETSP1338-20131121/106697_1 /TAXON_ID=43686 ORGANISM="Pelagodinium beii, Strain RCC1491" /NCGR_SAMPLE_ID=MMETSP1338 /ASSEMBLY_ACC=CAM_ASM_000754 /LENGTH=33 /DNA_ID= /DNA_START= /DNA_END= /DNA_ORIENTATION=